LEYSIGMHTYDIIAVSQDAQAIKMDELKQHYDLSKVEELRCFTLDVTT
jgi:hypothetical protein